MPFDEVADKASISPRFKPQSKIAVIGAGISGLAVADLLSSHHRVTLYEAEKRLGGHARTIDVHDGRFSVDTGFMVFNKKTYPHLTELFKRLDIPLIHSPMGFAASLDDGKFEYGFHDMKGLFARKRNAISPPFWLMLKDLFKWFKEARHYGHIEDITLGEVMKRMGMSESFKSLFLYPFAGAIWSTSIRQISDFPAASLIRFFDNHGLLSVDGTPRWYGVKGGSKVYVERLATKLQSNGVQIWTGRGVDKVRRQSTNSVTVLSEGEKNDYDAVIFACHSDQALRLLDDPSMQERRLLGAISYKPNRVITHKDIRQMPCRKACWASWNYVELKNDSQSKMPGTGKGATFTYWLNRLQGHPEEYPVFVTLNPETEIPEELVYDETTLYHPQFDMAALQAQKLIPELQGYRNTWYCGAWLHNGFHEDGIQSAFDIESHILAAYKCSA